MEEVSAEQRNDQKSARSGDKVSQMEDGRPMQWESASALQETCLPLAESGNWQVRNPDRNGRRSFTPFSAEMSLPSEPNCLTLRNKEYTVHSQLPYGTNNDMIDPSYINFRLPFIDVSQSQSQIQFNLLSAEFLCNQVYVILNFFVSRG
jgi:hypothetical protein